MKAYPDLNVFAAAEAAARLSEKLADLTTLHDLGEIRLPVAACAILHEATVLAARLAEDVAGIRDA